MPFELKIKESARVALALSAAFPLTGAAATAGRVDFAIGSVTALTTDGRSRTLGKGAEINSGDTITTGDGRAQLRFTDGAQVSLLPGTQYRIDDYRYNGANDGDEKSFFSLLKGGFRTITGLIGKRDRQAYKVNTNTATIGIRGTEFLVRDENGITVSTGEGLVEVCTTAGCIVLASGESAVVRDKEGLPVRITNAGSDSTNAKPETPSVKIDYSKNDEGLPAITSGLPSGPGYAVAFADGGEGIACCGTFGHSSGTATFNSGGELTQFVADGAEGETYQVTTMAGGFTDGTIGWGRWTAGAFADNSPSTASSFDIHYVVGKPTDLGEMAALASANLAGTYTLIGATAPTAFDAFTLARTVGAGSVTGNLTADFGAGSVTYSLSNINFTGSGGANYGVTGGAFISGAQFSGSGGAVIGGGSTGGLNVSGLFVGVNAARAGLVYKFFDGDLRISGAAAFKQTGLGPGSVCGYC